MQDGGDFDPRVFVKLHSSKSLCASNPSEHVSIDFPKSTIPS